MGRHIARASLLPYHPRLNDGNRCPNALIHPSIKTFCIFPYSSYIYYYLFIFTQATQGVLSMEARVFRLTEKLQKNDVEHEKNMSEVLASATDNYKKLEDEHFKNINIMKEVEERARTEEGKRIQMEAELIGMQEKMKKLESECLLSIGKAHQERMEEGMAKGKELGKEGAMDEVKAQFQMVYNSGFRHGWKSALSKTEQPETSDLFLHANTPLPYPQAGLKNFDDEAEEEDAEEEGEEEEGEEEEGTVEVQGEKDRPLESSQPEPIDQTADVPGQPPSS
jgi:hypothetical protein